MEAFTNKVFRIEGKVQHYAWGGTVYLPHLLQMPNPDNKPFAEYWMGAHDNASASLVFTAGKKTALNKYIATFPIETLGEKVVKKFGRLPYLLKILDVKDMLSIQVHPSKENAEKEFAGENNKGIKPDSLQRNYKDDNHKPELMMALGEFWLLHGFKSKGELKKTLLKIPELNFLAPVLEKGYEQLYRTVMEMDQANINSALQPLLDRIIPAYKNNLLKKDDQNFWAARAALTFSQPHKTDRGIFSIYFFNLVKLQPGEAIFQDAGLPHAYLEGQNVEIMANSDNVLRGGLTLKYIDVKELMKHVQFETTIPNIIREKNRGNHIAAFITPARDFELRKIILKKGDTVSLLSQSTNIYILLQGEITVRENAENEFSCEQGQSWLSFDAASYEVHAIKDAVMYGAGIP